MFVTAEAVLALVKWTAPTSLDVILPPNVKVKPVIRQLCDGVMDTRIRVDWFVFSGVLSRIIVCPPLALTLGEEVPAPETTVAP